jgi:hypothetical protein
MAAGGGWAEKLDEVRAGIERFAAEGYVSWSRENVARLFHPEALASERVQEVLRDWHVSGAIDLSGEEQAFMRVLDTDRLT